VQVALQARNSARDRDPDFDGASREQLPRLNITVVQPRHCETSEARAFVRAQATSKVALMEESSRINVTDRDVHPAEGFRLT
jgi:hypothetical protein